jgi:hypothetical protein
LPQAANELENVMTDSQVSISMISVWMFASRFSNCIYHSRSNLELCQMRRQEIV